MNRRLLFMLPAVGGGWERGIHGCGGGGVCVGGYVCVFVGVMGGGGG